MAKHDLPRLDIPRNTKLAKLDAGSPKRRPAVIGKNSVLTVKQVRFQLWRARNPRKFTALVGFLLLGAGFLLMTLR